MIINANCKLVRVFAYLFRFKHKLIQNDSKSNLMIQLKFRNVI